MGVEGGLAFVPHSRICPCYTQVIVNLEYVFIDLQFAALPAIAMTFAIDFY